jgi:hypothetical protein
MWARSDFLGGWVFSRGTRDIHKSVIDVDYELLDVTSVKRGPRGDYPAICRHSGFWDRDEYVTAVTTLAATVPAVPPSDGPAGRVPSIGAAPGINSKPEAAESNPPMPTTL